MVVFYNMNRDERYLIDQYFPQITQDVIPVDMLPYLNCLTQNDREAIASEEMRQGHMRAAQELLSRLRRRTDGFEQLIQALNATGCEHLANLLVPREQVCVFTLHIIIEDPRGDENLDDLPEGHGAGHRLNRETPAFREQVALDDN
ncbi:uncharacterized protein [Montipora capricornis]|uniref:uncharacterized protein isoform X1 n=1 Tax=Montipora capricornis TaxID=246305 RepID=UPI0035F1F6D4